MSEGDVLSVIRDQEDATARGDAGANVNAMSSDVVMFDLPPPLVYRGEQARNIEALEAWFATWSDGVKVHLVDPQFIIEGDLAVAFGLSRMTGIKTDGTKVDSWSRRTIVLKRNAGIWKIVHEHSSFPLAMDGSGRAVTDLLP
ncbi:Ketosteroid isomerase homolog [Kaistia soli DSM 19436]|uniref:Ketosteroid isomerase homolog n=1 Tax=Kaistia soli DSM 19436 TaxID=1122133 RepID=A0A1M5PBK9_9HYPH|nr:nuclear transport factor 2 family protein [Kaistia soli]SHG98839.1 Ketosteroid isomerase homolog [Kaistia soli DSM 19436]